MAPIRLEELVDAASFALHRRPPLFSSLSSTHTSTHTHPQIMMLLRSTHTQTHRREHASTLSSRWRKPIERRKSATPQDEEGWVPEGRGQGWRWKIENAKVRWADTRPLGVIVVAIPAASNQQQPDDAAGECERPEWRAYNEGFVAIVHPAPYPHPGTPARVR